MLFMFIIRLLFTVAVAAGFFYAIRRLLKLIRHTQPNENQVRNDVEKMRLSLAATTDDLVPWNDEEMELLSLEHVNKKLRRGNIAEAEGTLVSIYQEPMINYGYKKYISPHNAVLYAKTSNREYIYRIRKKGIQIYLDNEPMGVLKSDGVLYNRRKKRIAQIHKQKNEPLNPIIVNNREIGNLVNPKLTDKVNPRAFDLLTPMEKQEEDVFLSVAILELVMNAMSKK